MTLAAVMVVAQLLAACSNTSVSSSGPTPPPTGATNTPTASLAAASPAPASPTAAPSVIATAAPTRDTLALAALFEGTYSGTWTNTTYGSTGAVSLQVKLDRAARTITLTMTLGGNVFGAPAPKPESVTATLGGDGKFSYTSTTFGPVNVAVTYGAASADVTASAPNVPSTRIATFTAKATLADPTTMNFTYTVTFRDSTPPAQGRATLTRS